MLSSLARSLRSPSAQVGLNAHRTAVQFTCSRTACKRSLRKGGQLEISNQSGRQRHGPLFALLKGLSHTATSSYF